MKIAFFKFTMITAIFAVLFYAYKLSNEGFEQIEEINAKTVKTLQVVKTPRFTITYGSIERENGTTTVESGYIVGMDSSVLISSVGFFPGYWIAPDAFRTRNGNIVCFNEENVRVFSYVSSATGNKTFMDVYVRKD
jgi:hypothetical protein